MRDRRAVDTMRGIRGPGRLGGGCERCCDGGADKCSSIHGRHFTPSGREGNRDSVKKERAFQPGRTAPPQSRLLKLEPQAELHTARQVRTAGMQEARTADAAWVTRSARRSDAVHAAVDSVVLRMVEKVEVLPAKIEFARFAEREALEKAEIEVDAAGVGQGASAHVAEG